MDAVITAMSVIITLVLAVLLIHVYNDYDVMYYGIREFFGELEGLPTSAKNIMIAGSVISHYIDGADFTFIDFGCGTAGVLIGLSDKFRQLIGVELNPKLADVAIDRARFCNNISIINQNMVDYEFRDTPTVLYMFEPLWQVPIDDALMVYDAVMKNFSKIRCEKYVLYITGLMRADVSDMLGGSKSFELVERKRLGLYPYRELYLYKGV